MTTELFDFADAVEDLLVYLDETSPEEASRDEIRNLMHELTAAYVNYADSVDKAAVEDVS